MCALIYDTALLKVIIFIPTKITKLTKRANALRLTSGEAFIVFIIYINNNKEWVGESNEQITTKNKDRETRTG